ncbi:MAG: hypothetical protein LBT33_11370 [Spirochaetia bacterium]|jgi:hypothetical protein|nr:hypothetical protein [Spirochaetia bacterium]
MKNKAILLAVLVVVAFSACENIFEDTIANKDSAEADAEDLELALSRRNYDAVIKGLGFDPDATADPTQAELAALRTREKYLLQMAWLGKTGFSTVDVLDAFLKDDSGHTSDILLQSFSSGDLASNDVLDFKQKRYKWTKKIQEADAADDKNIKTAAGIAATLDTLMSVMRVANALAGTDVSFNKDDPNYIGNIIGGKTPTEIEAEIDTVFDLSGSGNLDSIQENIELLNGTIISLVPDGDTDMYDKFNEFITTFDADGDGQIDTIDKTSLAEFIYNQWH